MHTPLILIEVVLVFGGALLFGWWQLRSVARDQQRTREERARAEAAEASKPAAGAAQVAPPHGLSDPATTPQTRT